MDKVDDNDISTVLSIWNEITALKKKLEKYEDSLKNKIKVFLKERQWDRYKDDKTDISISINTISREVPNVSQMKSILSDAQLAQVLRTTSYEKLSIITPEARKRMKKIVQNKL